MHNCIIVLSEAMSAGYIYRGDIKSGFMGGKKGLLSTQCRHAHRQGRLKPRAPDF